MQLVGRKVTVALRDAPLVPGEWGRQVGVPVLVAGVVAEQFEHGFHVEPIEMVHLNSGAKLERDKNEIPYRGILVFWRSISSVALH